MLKITHLIGLPVLDNSSGIQIGEVQEVVLQLNEAKVEALLLKNSSLFSEAAGVNMMDLFSIGKDAVTLRDRSAVEILHSEGTKWNQLMDKSVYTETGLLLGKIVDLIFEGHTGEIKGYELSDGFVQDLLQGRKMMPFPIAQVMSEDRLMVPEKMAELLQPQPEIV